MPAVRRPATASCAKLAVHIVSVGIPRFSSSVESWIHHDVHAPQSPTPAITALVPEVRAASHSRGLGWADPGPSTDLSNISVRNWYFAANSLAIELRRSDAFCFPLLSNPIRAPAWRALLSAARLGDSGRDPSGSRTYRDPTSTSFVRFISPPKNWRVLLDVHNVEHHCRSCKVWLSKMCVFHQHRSMLETSPHRNWPRPVRVLLAGSGYHCSPHPYF
jgi:hypothetical protein